jgi:hypothetical protein
MYHLLQPNFFLDKPFRDAFTKENPKPVQIIQERWHEDKLFVTKLNKVYNTQYFKESYQILTTMICELYGEETSVHFKLEWFPIAHNLAEEGKIFNWAHILSNNIFQNVQESHTNKKLGFYMSYFLIDAIFTSIHFPEMNWSWNPNSPSIHVYFSEPWENNFKKYFYEIYNHFVSPLFHIIFFQPLQRLSSQTLETLREIGV